MTPENLFLICLFASLAAASFSGWRFGKENALGVGMACSMLAASWYDIRFGAVPMSVASATAALLMIAYCLHSGAKIWSPLTMIDLSVAVLVIWHVIVDVHYGGPFTLTSFTSYGEWGLPYVAGRFAFQERGSLHRLAPFFAVAAVLISVLTVVETLTAINVWEWISPRDDRVWFLRVQRYGLLYRSSGPTRHAIFLGVILLTMIPFVFAVFDSSKADKQRRRISLAAIAILAAGILATASRGPVLAGILVVIGSLAYRYTIARNVTGVAAAVLAAVVFLFPNQMLELLEANPLGRGHSNVVQLKEGQEAEIHTGTRNRLMLFKVYGPLVVKGGLIGYGSEASRGFPPNNIPGLPEDPAVRERVGIVDNTFIGMGLRFGMVGLAILVACFVSTIVTTIMMVPQASTYFYPHSSLTIVVFAATIAAVGLELLTVYFDHDHGFWVLFAMGVVAGLKVSTRSDQDLA